MGIKKPTESMLRCFFRNLKNPKLAEKIYQENDTWGFDSYLCFLYKCIHEYERLFNTELTSTEKNKIIKYFTRWIETYTEKMSKEVLINNYIAMYKMTNHDLENLFQEVIEFCFVHNMVSVAFKDEVDSMAFAREKVQA